MSVCVHVYLQSPIHIERPLEDVVFKSITLKTVHGRKIFHTWKEIERMVDQDQYVLVCNYHCTL